MRSERTSTARLHSGLHSLTVPLPCDRETGWKSHPVFKGSTLGVEHLSCHVTAQTFGTRPHPAHSHREEEILLLLLGEIDVVLPDAAAPEGERRIRLRPRQFVYYPSFCVHTVETTSEDPANYLVMRWFNRQKTHFSAVKRFGVFDIKFDPEAGEGFASRLVFKQPTRYLRRLRCHTTLVAPGKGQELHVDQYEVVGIIMQGELETLGGNIGTNGILHYAAEEPHGMHNAGQETAMFVIFEFHGLTRGLVGGLIISTWRLHARACRKAYRLARRILSTV